MRMPPPSVKHPLTPGQREILRRWIANGAEHRPHWAFVAPGAVSPPRVQFSGFNVRNPIDGFIGDRLKRERLKPSPEADRLTLARRVHLDLIGLPPNLRQAEAPGARRLCERSGLSTPNTTMLGDASSFVRG